MPRRSTELSAPKVAGAHYTPDSLAVSFVEEALRVWDQYGYGWGGHEIWERNTSIVDPAAGDGALLLAAASGIWGRLQATPKHRALRTSDEILTQRALRVCRGVELREDAAAVARGWGLDVQTDDGLAAGASAAGALVLMNPPWVGRSKRDAATTARIKAITGCGAADLAIAFLRSFPTARQISAILPAGAAEGDNRKFGLATLLAEGWKIVSATSRAKWPGDAKVMYVTVHLRR